VRVRVIVPGSSDVKVVQWATRHFYEYLLKRGIRVYERNDQMLHSKVIVIDHRWSVIGSCNLDARSLRLNLEFFAVVHSRGLAAAVDRICREEMRQSTRITTDYCRRRSLWQRVLGRAAWAARRWL
jgi:cardiolipin synthase